MGEALPVLMGLLFGLADGLTSGRERRRWTYVSLFLAGGALAATLNGEWALGPWPAIVDGLIVVACAFAARCAVMLASRAAGRASG